MTNREILCQMGYEDSICFESPDFDAAIIGVEVVDERVVYDYDEMAKTLAEQENISIEEAVDFIEYNTIRSLPYVANPPIVMKRLIKD